MRAKTDIRLDESLTMRQMIMICTRIMKVSIHHPDRHIKQELSVDGFQLKEEEMQVEEMLITVFVVAIAVSPVDDLSENFSG